MISNITKTAPSQGEAQTAPQLFDDWFDPIETAVPERAREFIEELIRSELDATLARPRYDRSKKVGDPARNRKRTASTNSRLSAAVPST
jgi:hypothetical protein